MADYIVHKAVELKKVNKAAAVTDERLRTEYICQPKYDGCNCVLVVDSTADKWFSFYSRTGEVVKSMMHVAAALSTLPGGIADGVYFGEAWAHDLTFPEISGRFRKQSMTDETAQLQLVLFDFVTLTEWEAGIARLSYTDRVARMPEILQHISLAKSPIGLAGSMGVLSETWPKATPQDIANKLVAAGGYDGAIFRSPNGYWRKGDSGTHGELVKVKPRIRATCQVVGWEPGKGKHAGKIGTLVIQYNGKRQGAGTGLKDSERDCRRYDSDWHGELVEIEALGVTEDGYLREPVLLGLRSDVVDPD